MTNTSGWAAGVQLTALAARSATAIANGAWSESVDMLTDDYVWREVLAAGDPDSVEVMLQVSVVDRVNAEIMNVLAMPEVIEKLNGMGVDAARPNKPPDFAAFMKDDVARWKSVVKTAGIQVD